MSFTLRKNLTRPLTQNELDGNFEEVTQMVTAANATIAEATTKANEAAVSADGAASSASSAASSAAQAAASAEPAVDLITAGDPAKALGVVPFDGTLPYIAGSAGLALAKVEALEYEDGVPLTISHATQIVLRGDDLYRAKLPATLPLELSGTWATDSALVTPLTSLTAVVVNSIEDLLNPSLAGRQDIVVRVQRYWSGVTQYAGGGDFIWLDSPKSNHDGGVRISPTVPWDGTQSGHSDFLNAVGETSPGENGYWLRVVAGNLRSPVFYGASTVSVVPDCAYILAKFEAAFPNSKADLLELDLRVSSYPSGAKYFNGVFTRISDLKAIEPGWSGVVRVGNRNALVGRNTATNLTTNSHEETGGKGYNLTALGDGALYSAGNNVKHNTAIGPNSLYNNQYARYNIGVGLEALFSLTGDAGDEDVGSRNVVVGDNGARFNQGDQNVVLGRNAMQVNTIGRQNVYLGSACGGGIGPVGLDGETIQNPFPTMGDLKTAAGTLALNWGYASETTALGAQALENLKGGVNNLGVGARAMRLLESNLSPKGTLISATGSGAVTWTVSGTTLTVDNASHANSVANVVAITFTSGVPSNVVGVTQYLTVASVSAGVSWTVELSAAEVSAMSASGSATVVEVYRNTVQPTNDNNTGVGNLAGQNLITAVETTLIGQASGINLTSATQVTAVGRSSLRFMQDASNATSLTNCTGVGYDTRVSGNNQVQLGNAATTTYVYGTVQNRSDVRDKADVEDTRLGIEFINGLRPVSGRWDMREDYLLEYPEPPLKPTDPWPAYACHTESLVDGEEAGSDSPKEIPSAAVLAKYKEDLKQYKSLYKEFEEECARVAEHNRAIYSDGIRDGSKKRSRRHQWFIAQEVAGLCERLGVEFGGLQHHSHNGGSDVYSLGYDEFIPPVVKSVQECWKRLDDIESRLARLEGKRR